VAPLAQPLRPRPPAPRNQPLQGLIAQHLQGGLHRCAGGQPVIDHHHAAMGHWPAAAHRVVLCAPARKRLHLLGALMLDPLCIGAR